jgi:nicotinate-nucleotide adenylyltransferase
VTAAIFGGTFDPIHLGHLVVADHVAEAAGLVQVLFVPAGRPPHKEGRPITPAADRLAMVELAIAGNPRFSVSRVELDHAGGPSFTIDTVRRRKAAGERDVALILGADSLVEFGTWREPEALVTECRVLVVGRPGVDLERAPAHLVAKVTFIEAPRLDISSSEIRERVAAGRSIRYLVPESVREYILSRGLYRPAGDGAPPKPGGAPA